MNGNPIGLEKGNILDHHSQEQFSVGRSDAWAVPDAGKVLGQCPDLSSGLRVEKFPVSLALSVMLLLQLVQMP